MKRLFVALILLALLTPFVATAQDLATYDDGTLAFDYPAEWFSDNGAISNYENPDEFSMLAEINDDFIHVQFVAEYLSEELDDGFFAGRENADFMLGFYTGVLTMVSGFIQPPPEEIEYGEINYFDDYPYITVIVEGHRDWAIYVLESGEDLLMVQVSTAPGVFEANQELIESIITSVEYNL